MSIESYYPELNVRPDIPIMKEWVSALRSGRYDQATDVLRSAEDDCSFCCLGVVCDLYAHKGKGEWRDVGTFVVDGYIQESVLPMPIATLLFGTPLRCMESGLLPIYTRSQNAVTLSDLNDSGLTFGQIADLIEYFFIKPYEGASDGQS